MTSSGVAGTHAAPAQGTCQFGKILASQHSTVGSQNYFHSQNSVGKFYLSVSKAEKVLSTEIKGMDEVWGHSGDKLREGGVASGRGNGVLSTGNLEEKCR